MPDRKFLVVAMCKDNSREALESGEKLPFFSFLKQPKIKNEWVRNCYSKHVWYVANKRICSKHFKPEDSEDDLQLYLQFTFWMGTEAHDKSQRLKRMLRKENNVIVNDLIKRTTETPLNIEQPADETKAQKESVCVV